MYFIDKLPSCCYTKDILKQVNKAGEVSKLQDHLNKV